MTVRYVGAGGNDSNAGTSWATRKLTLNGAEDTPVVAGDIVYVGPGTYRESLTVDVSGTSGNTIQYIGDFTGKNTDGVGGVVRWTGSDDDITATRNNCVTASSKNYRTFSGFTFDLFARQCFSCSTATYFTIQNCHFTQYSASYPVLLFNVTSTNLTVQNCYFMDTHNSYGISFSNASTQDNAGHLVQNCIFIGGAPSIIDDRVGGITIKNSLFYRNGYAIRVTTALTVGQTVTVNNNIFHGTGTTALTATATGEITEDYNTFFSNNADRSNVDTGTHSVTTPPIYDTRWFHNIVQGKQILTPFDLGAACQLINVAGTSPSSTDMRGTGTVGTQREWGALEYDTAVQAGIIRVGGDR